VAGHACTGFYPAGDGISAVDPPASLVQPGAPGQGAGAVGFQKEIGRSAVTKKLMAQLGFDSVPFCSGKRLLAATSAVSKIFERPK